MSRCHCRAFGRSVCVVCSSCCSTLLLDAGVNVRGVFIVVTPRMLEIVGFGSDGFMALLLDAGVGLVVGLTGAGVRVLPDQWRRSVLYALAAMLLVSLSEPLLTPIFNGIGLRAVGEFLYLSGGLTVAGAIVIFLVSAGLIYSRERFRKPPSPVEDQAPTPITDRPLVTRNRVVLAIVGVVLVVLPGVVGDRIADILGTVGVYVLLGLGLNIVVGYAGLLDLGYVAFFAVGAYSLRSSPRSPPWSARNEGERRGPAHQLLGGTDHGGHGRSHRGADRRPRAAAPRRLSGHRHPRVRRNHPDLGPKRLAGRYLAAPKESPKWRPPIERSTSDPRR